MVLTSAKNVHAVQISLFSFKVLYLLLYILYLRFMFGNCLFFNNAQ